MSPVEDRRENRMQSASFELPGGAPVNWMQKGTPQSYPREGVGGHVEDRKGGCDVTVRSAPIRPLFPCLIRVKGNARKNVTRRVDGNQRNRMQSASFELLGGALFYGEEGC